MNTITDLGIDVQKQVNKVYKNINHDITTISIYDLRHGGPYDRGGADSYYSRGMNPHYFVADTHNSAIVEGAAMTESEIIAYEAGYNDNEKAGEHKDWGVR